MSIVGLYCTQSAGLDGAAETSSFSVNAPIGNNVGLGILLVNDKLAPQIKIIYRQISDTLFLLHQVPRYLLTLRDQRIYLSLILRS